MASDGADGDYFGWSVSIYGNIAAIGSPGDDDNENVENSGNFDLKYYEELNSWIIKLKLIVLQFRICVLLYV